MTKVSFDTLLGGYSVYRFYVGKRGYSIWQRLSNHKTYDEAKQAERTLV